VLTSAAALVREAQSSGFLGAIGHGIVVLILVIFFIGLVIGLIVGFVVGRLFARRR
jgi:membrane protein DedA with SNARE-associated domain